MTRLTRLLTNVFLILGAAVLLWLCFSQWGKVDGRANLYVWQADAWLHGRTDLPNLPSKMIDVAVWKDKIYVPFPPFPSLLVLPLVALLGVINSNTLPVTFVLTLISARALWQIGERLGQDRERRWWLVAAMLLGTGYTNALIYGHSVWFFAHAVSFCSLLLFVAECLGKQRGWLLGLLLGISFLSRQMTAFAFLLPLLLLSPRPRNLAGFLALFGPSLAIYLWYNQLRFGSPFTTGYDFLELQGPLKVKAAQFGLFHPAFVPYNLTYLLFQGPHLVFGGQDNLKYLGVDVAGTALPLASPFLLAVFGAKASKEVPARLLRMIGIVVALILIPTLFYYNNGYQQINCQRFTLDFLPLLVVPLVLGQARLGELPWRALVLWSVLLNAIMLWR